MAITRHAAGTLATSTTATISIAYPTNSVGDIILLFVQDIETTFTITTPSGWTPLASAQGVQTGTGSLTVFWQYVSVVQTGSTSVTFSGGTNKTGVMVSYSGASSTLPTVVGVQTQLGVKNITSSSLAFSNYAVWGLGSSASNAATLSSVASTAGGWTPSAAATSSAANYVMSVYDGAIGTATTTLTASYSAFVAQANIAIVLVPSTSVAGFKVYTNGSFAIKPVKVWTGTAWATKPLKKWTGSAWVAVNGASTPKLTRSGNALQINGVTKRLGGANAYWLGLDDNNGGTYGTFPTHNQITSAIAGMAEMGVNLVRAHSIGISAGTPNSFETAPGVYSDSNMDSSDWAVFQAKKAGIYLMIPLTDNWNYYHGGKWNFVHWAYGQNPSGITDTPGTIKDDTNERIFFANTAPGLRIRALFKDYISNWLNHLNPYTGLRYKDDPTIAIIETGNEIYYASQIGSNEWTQDICSYVKSIAPDKLMADGSAATNVAVSAAPGLTATACDIVGSHYYTASPDYSTSIGFTATPSIYGTTTSALGALQADVASAVASSKVYLLGEYPWTRSDVSSWYSYIESTPAISASMFWSNIANTDAGVPESHGGAFGSDDYPVHRPYSGSFEQAYAPALSRHISALSGIIPTNSAGTATVPNLITSTALRRASDASLFTIGSGTISNDSTVSMEGGSSIKVTPSGSGVFPYWYFTTPSNGAPVTAGSQYTGVASVRTTTSSSLGFQAVMVWYKADGSYISSTNGTYASALQNVWMQYTVSGTAPSLAAYAVVQVQAGAMMNASDVFNVDEYGVFAGTVNSWTA